MFISKGKVAMPDLPAGTVTFIFADLEDGNGDVPGSSDTDHYDAAFRRAVQTNGGHIYKKVSNAFQVAFPTAGMAVAAAAQAQRELQGSSGGSQSLIPNKARMALHSGVTDIRDGGYVGPLLNRVARLLAAAMAVRCCSPRPRWNCYEITLCKVCRCATWASTGYAT